MKENKKRIILTSLLLACVALLVILGVLSLITKSFEVNVILHSYMRFLSIPIIIMLLQKNFKDQLNKSMKTVLILCAVVLTIDLVIVDAFRFVLSNGVSTVLFLPACFPLCFMIIMFYSAKDTGREKSRERKLTYIVGIPLLLLSLYFEVLSFVQV